MTIHSNEAGKFEMEELRKNNPEFAKLIDLLSTTYQEDGIPKSIRQQLEQTELRLHTVKQNYLEQQLFTSELKEALSMQTQLHKKKPPSEAAVGSSDSGSTKPHSSSRVITATSEVQHCLDMAPGLTLLGLQIDHLRTLVEKSKGNKVSKHSTQQVLEERLRDKCFRVMRWQTPDKDPPSNSTLQLAKMGQLPQLLSRQKEEVERFKEELKESKKQCREMMAEKIKVLGDMYESMKYALEQYKLVQTARSNEVSLDYLQSKCQAMLGKLDVLHHQLLKGVCSEGRIQALTEIQSHLLAAQRQLTEELSQMQQVLSSYQSLGEEFMLLSQQYREVREEIENKQWALAELNKTHT